jgi:hypothetical protein
MTPPIDQFVPLVAAAPSTQTREFQITVIPQTEQPHPFQSLGKEDSTAAERPLFRKNCEPHLSVQRDSGRITNIRIQCNCGQTIDLACIYEDISKPFASKPAETKSLVSELPETKESNPIKSESKPPEAEPLQSKASPPKKSAKK